MSSCRIVHYGDWDPVGLDEYLRIKDACPELTSFFVPDNLEEWNQPLNVLYSEKPPVI